MLAPDLRWHPEVRQIRGDNPGVLSQILEDGVNLSIWQRQLPAHIEDFGALLLAQGQPLAESMTLEMGEGDGEPNLQGLAAGYTDLQGYAGFIADVSWLVSAYACLLGASCVDHVPVRLISTYAGIGSQWLKEGVIDRKALGSAEAEPQDPQLIQQINCGDVALLKGERWIGNEGHGLVHRSPQPRRNERRLLLTLDWLA
jgi:hypothetical protein